jgi:predicted small metal-binding protein
MREFRCAVLVPGCWVGFEGDSGDEILEQIAVHAREEHGMDEVPPEIRAAISERSP